MPLLSRYPAGQLAPTDQVDGPSGRFAQAASALVRQINEEGLSTMKVVSS